MKSRGLNTTFVQRDRGDEKATGLIDTRRSRAEGEVDEDIDSHLHRSAQGDTLLLS